MRWWLEKIPTMVGTAAFGLLGQWLLRVKFPDTPLLHGGYWILLIALAGTYLDHRKRLLPAVWKNRPVLFGIALLFVSNILIAYWMVMLLDGLGLGFDTSVLSGKFRFFALTCTLLALIVLLTGVFADGEQDSRPGAE